MTGAGVSFQSCIHPRTPGLEIIDRDFGRRVYI